jgi:hypothetical protein
MEKRMSLHNEPVRRRIRRKWLCCCAPFALLAACGESSGSGGGVVVRDSAGVTIIENGGDVWATPAKWRLAPDPVVRIGVAEGDEPYLLDGVRTVRLLSDGGILLANGGDNTLRWYDADGRFLFRRGGEGGGPGEFARLGAITLADADTVIAADWSARRLTIFTADGTLVGTAPIVGLTGPPGAVYPLADGSLVMGISGFSTQQLGDNIEDGTFRLPSPLLKLTRDGERADTIGMFPGMEIQITTRDGGFRIGGATLGKGLSYAVAGEEIYIGTQDRFEIDVYSPDGHLLRSIRAPGVDVTVGPDYVGAYRDWMRGRLSEVPPEERAEAERTIAETDLPAAAPAYSAFFIDSSGNLWVGEHRFDLEPPEKWLVFDPDGTLVTSVSTPPSFRPMSVTGDLIAGRATDDLGVEQVVVYAIQRVISEP